MTPFVGRQGEIAAVRALVERPDVRLVTITGPGGAGKSRLARRIMEMHAVGTGQKQSFFVALAPVQQPGFVLPAVAGTLGLPDQSPISAMRHFLSQESTLLVVDNLEHLLDEATWIVHDLLQSCPDLTVLATSRVRLGLSGEHVFPLGALDPQDALALFIARAQAAHHDFAATPADMPAIDAICDKVDRLPLAIELAAARVRMLPLSSIIIRLDSRLDLLTGGPRDAPDRQRTMKSAIAWSYDLLPVHLQRLFRQLGVFVGGFSIEAAQAVGGVPDATLDYLDELVAASLLEQVATDDDDPRFAMLETIREFALTQLIGQGEEAAARSALLHHLIDIAERQWAAPTGFEAEIWLARSVREAANIRAILDWAIDRDPVEAVRLTSAMFDFWVYHAGAMEGLRWLDRGLAAVPPLPPPLRLWTLCAAGGLTLSLSDLDRAEVYLDEATTLAQAIDDTRMLAFSAGILAETRRGLGRHDSARAAQEIEWQAARTLGEPLGLAIATLNRGQAAMADGDLPRAQALFDEAVSLHRQSGSRLGVAIAQWFLSETMLESGDTVGALEQLRAAIHGFVSVAARVQVSSTIIRLAETAIGRTPASSACLLAGVISVLDPTGILLLPDDAGIVKRIHTQAQSDLGTAAFTIAWESGSRLDLDGLIRVVDETVSALVQPVAAPMHDLSPRELDVLRLVATGMSNRDIASDLSISERTVGNHLLHIMTKLNVRSRTAAATWAVRRDLV